MNGEAPGSRHTSQGARMLAWRGGLDSPCEWVSESWVAFTGYTLEQAGGDRWWTLVHPDERETCRASYRQAYASRRPFELEYRLRHYTGEYRLVVDAGMPVLGTDGTFSGYLGYCIDQSGCKQSDEVLDQLQERYQSILHSMIDGVFGLDASGNTTFVNPAVTAILGWTAEDLLGKSMHELVHYAYPDGTVYHHDACPIYQTIRDGQSRSIDTECFWRKDGRTVRVAYVCAPIIDKKGKITGVTVTLRDISEKVQARKALQVAQEQLEVMFHSVPAMIFYKDCSNRILRANWYAAVMLGCSTQELEGKQMEDLFPFDAAEQYRADLEVIQAGRPKRGSIERYYNADCEERWAETDRIPYVGLGGGIEGIIVFSRDITDRKQAEHALRSAEAQFKAAFEVMSVGYTQADLSGRYIRVNRKFCEMSGYREDELLTMTILDLTHPEDRERSKQEFERVLKRESHEFRLEMRYVRKDGSIWWGDLTVNVCCDEMDAPLWMMAVHYDVTSRKSAETALRLSEECWQFALEGSQDGVWDWEPDTNRIYFSARWKNMLGYDEGEIENSYAGWNVLVHPDDLGDVEDALRAYLEGRSSRYESRYRMRAKSGEYRWILGRGKIITRHPDGRPKRVVGTISDITEMVKAEAALRMSEERWQFALEGSRDGVWDWCPSDGRAYFSPRWKAIIGYTDAEIDNTYQAWLALIHPEDVAKTEQAVMDYLAGKAPVYETEFRMRNKGGGYRWILARGKIMARLPDGRPLRVVGTHTDVTNRKQAEEKLRVSEERWQFALEESQSGVWDWHVDRDEIFFSPRWSQMLGYESQTKGMSVQEWSGRVHPDDFAKATVEMQRHLRQETNIYVSEIRVKTKDGAYRWILDRGKVMTWSPEGRPLRVLGTHTDISFLKQLQESLIESQVQFAEAFRHAPIGMALLGVDGRWLKVNPALCEILEYSEQELLQMRFQDVTYPDDLMTDVGYVLELLSGQRTFYKIEKRYITKSGRIVWVQRSVSYIPEMGGESGYFISQVEDISARKQAEDALRRSEAQFVSFMEHFKGFAWIKDDNGVYAYVNQELMRSVSQLKEMDASIIGGTDRLAASRELDLLSQGDKKVFRLMRPIQRVVQFGKGRAASVKLLVKFPLSPSSAGAAQLGGWAIDITKRVRAEEALKRSQNRLKEFLEARDQLSRDLHDNSIQMLYALGMDLYRCQDLLRNERDLTSCLEMVRLSVDRVNAVIRGLRMHLMDPGLVQRKSPEAVKAEVQQLLSQIEKAAGIAVVADIALEVLAMFDQAQTAELLGIIREGISNVARHAKARHCSVTLGEVEGAIVLEIKDDGVGGAVVSRSRSGRSHGLRNMAARARKIGASFALMSGKGAGTTVQVRILRG